GALDRQVVEAAVREGPHAAAEVADAGEDDACGVAHEAAVGGEPGVGADALERLLRRVEVADAVVEDGDECHGHPILRLRPGNPRTGSAAPQPAAPPRPGRDGPPSRRSAIDWIAPISS